MAGRERLQRRDRTRLELLVVAGWLALGVLLVAFSTLAFVLTHSEDIFPGTHCAWCSEYEPADVRILATLVVVAVGAGLLALIIALAPTRRTFAMSFAAVVLVSVALGLSAVVGAGMGALAPLVLLLLIGLGSWAAWLDLAPPRAT